MGSDEDVAVMGCVGRFYSLFHAVIFFSKLFFVLGKSVQTLSCCHSLLVVKAHTFTVFVVRLSYSQA